jgi:PKD repeat protein
MATLPPSGSQISFGQVNQAFAPPGNRTPGSTGNAPTGGRNIKLSAVLGNNPIYTIGLSTGTIIAFSATFGNKVTPDWSPVVDFTGLPTSGTAPLIVSFTDLSAFSPTSWAWDFDNNGSTDSTSQNPSTTYNSVGTYSVKLTATNAVGTGTLTKTSYITVNPPPPVVNFTASPTFGPAPLTVNFTDLSTNSPTSWAWDFDNNGSTDSTSQNPSTTYNLAGTYSVKLTATNASGSGTLTKTSYITALGPSVLVNYLVVAGGGGGGVGTDWMDNAGGGGGGGGGYLSTTSFSIFVGSTITVIVGAGGTAATITTGTGAGGTVADGTNGSNSSISSPGITTVTTIGGGVGGYYTPFNGITNGGNGGSGGGGGGAGGSQSRVGGTGTVGPPRQGFDGGNNWANDVTGSAGGGGGAGGPGEAGAPSNPGDGGIGLQNSITGTAIYYAGGGGGTNGNSLQTPGTGGLGGGGAGKYQSYSPNNGLSNTGGGGGSNGRGLTGQTGGSGGSGVVIISAPQAAASTTGSPTVTTSGGRTIYTFTASGTITF